jgi:hypothetical protein
MLSMKNLKHPGIKSELISREKKELSFQNAKNELKIFSRQVKATLFKYILKPFRNSFAKLSISEKLYLYGLLSIGILFFHLMFSNTKILALSLFILMTICIIRLTICMIRHKLLIKKAFSNLVIVISNITKKQILSCLLFLAFLILSVFILSINIASIPIFYSYDFLAILGSSLLAIGFVLETINILKKYWYKIVKPASLLGGAVTCFSIIESKKLINHITGVNPSSFPASLSFFAISYSIINCFFLFLFLLILIYCLTYILLFLMNFAYIYYGVRDAFLSFRNSSLYLFLFRKKKLEIIYEPKKSKTFLFIGHCSVRGMGEHPTYAKACKSEIMRGLSHLLNHHELRESPTDSSAR